MAEELKGEVFELRRTAGLSAKPFFPHVFPERRNVPESATMLLVGAGLVGLAGFRGKFRKNDSD